MSLLPETLTEPPLITDEEIQCLVEAAQCRISVLDDGTETLDGYELPPDDDKPWDDRILRGSTTTFYWRGDDLVDATMEHFERPSTLTNRTVRDSHIRLIALGKEPIFTRSDSLVSYDAVPREARVRGWQDKLRSVLWMN